VTAAPVVGIHLIDIWMAKRSADNNDRQTAIDESKQRVVAGPRLECCHNNAVDAMIKKRVQSGLFALDAAL
jgi:hypothetical protein